MPIWDILSTASANFNMGLLSDFMEAADTSSYTCTVGDQTSFVLGGTQAYNAIGSSINLTIDWEEVLSHVLTGGSLMGRGIGWQILSAGIFGIGGNADIVVGNDSSFNYFGESFSVNRNGHDFTCTVPTGSGMPISVKATLGLGSLSLIATSILTRFLYGLNTEADSTIASDTLILELIPELESTWLAVLKLFEFSASMAASLQADINTARTYVDSFECIINTLEGAIAASKNAGMSAQLTDLMKANVGIAQGIFINSGNLVLSGEKAQSWTLGSLVSRSKATAPAQGPITSQITADLYYLNSSSMMMTAGKGPILLMSQDYNNSDGSDAYGGIALNASQIGFSAQGTASITMTRQGYKANLPPGISLMTMGDDSSAISLIAQQKTAASPMASITSATDGITLSFGSKVPANSFKTQMNGTGVTIKQNQENGPQIQLGVDSIKLSVGNSSLTIANNGITINATSVQVISGDSNLSVANAGISTTFGETVSNTLNAQGHQIKAAESSAVIGAQAINLIAATLTGNLEAGNSIKATIQNMVTEAINTNKAGVNQNNPQ